MKTRLLILAIFFTVLTYTSIYGYTVPVELRIGLESKYKDITNASISNKQVILGYNNNGVFIPGASIEATSLSVSVSDEFFVKLPTKYEKFNEAMAQGIVAVSDWNYSVYLGAYPSYEQAQKAAANTGGQVISSGGFRIAVKDGGKIIAVFDSNIANPMIAGINGEPVNLGDRRYRGALEFDRSLNGKIMVINVLGLEEYLYSVVPSEMPSGWHIEALKAQAVAARSYTLTRMGVHKDYDLCDGTHCQNYLGSSNESNNATTAVSATTGQIAYYSGQPINAVYFSSSGGRTDDSENVWPNAIPYLKSVDDSFERSGKVWTRTFSLQDINNLLSANQISIGEAKGIEITSVENNRVQEMIIRGSSGNYPLRKEEISAFFAKSAEGSLASRSFTIGGSTVSEIETKISVYSAAGLAEYHLKGLYAISSSLELAEIYNISVQGKNTAHSYATTTTAITGGSSTGATIVINGKGWGHGVGMSQYGAGGMAEAGYGYIDILKHYYTGIEVK